MFTVGIKYSKEVSKLVYNEENVGVDIRTSEDKELLNDCRPKMFSTGIHLELPSNLWCHIVPRSGLASKGVFVMGGIVDPSYRGEIKVILMNCGEETINFKENDRIAQLVFHQVVPVKLLTIDELTDTERGSKGFGSSGLN